MWRDHTMAGSLPSTSVKRSIEKLGLVILIDDDTTSHDPIPPTCQFVEIEHSDSSQNASDGECDSTALVMAGESAATDEEVELRTAIEKDLCQLTIEQAEIETARDISRAIEEEEGNDEGNVKTDDLHEEKYGENPECPEDEDESGRGDLKHEVTVPLDGFHEEKGGKNADTVEDENENEDGWGNLENGGTVELGYLHEEKNGKNAERYEEDENVSGWGYSENGGAVKLDNPYEEKGGRYAEGSGYENVNGWGYWENQGAVKLNNSHEEKGARNRESVEDEGENRWGNLENEWGNEVIQGKFGSKAGDAMTKLGRYNPSDNNRWSDYPLRPDAEDCAFYMKCGSCKFGLNCKFNHPPKRKNQGVQERFNNSERNSERAGQTQCKYYLSPGGCRYGKDCNYSHGSDKSSTSHNLEFNFLGLPVRPGEKECMYYMRTGTCKYGSNCRFNHPEPTTVVGSDTISGYENMGPPQNISSSSISLWSSPMTFNEPSSFKPVTYSRTQVAPNSDPKWNSFQAATYPTTLPTPPAFALKNPTEIDFPIPYRKDMVLEEYPERPGEAECSFFMKTGDCKFKSSCKFHHPKNRISKSSAGSFSLNDKGLPLRPDQPICTHYHRYGICKYGPACKYDHPSNYGNLPTPFRNLKITGASR